MADLDKEIKIALHKKCQEWIDQRIQNARIAMNAAEEAKQNETKSSVGDKYETGRAMMQMEQEKNKVQLIKAMQEKKALSLIDPHKTHFEITTGSLVMMDRGKYYLSIGIGKLVVNGEAYYVVSPLSPIGRLLMKKQAGETINFNGKMQVIEHVL